MSVVVHSRNQLVAEFVQRLLTSGMVESVPYQLVIWEGFSQFREFRSAYQIVRVGNEVFDSEITLVEECELS